MSEYLKEDYRYSPNSNVPPPKYCPLCGRELETWHWTTLGNDREYPSLVCYGDKGSLSRWLSRKISSTTPVGAHYEAQLKVREIAQPPGKPTRFDRYTGKQEAE